MGEFQHLRLLCILQEASPTPLQLMSEGTKVASAIVITRYQLYICISMVVTSGLFVIVDENGKYGLSSISCDKLLVQLRKILRE